MTNEQKIPKSEEKEARWLDRYLFKAMDWLGLTSGIGIVSWGAWWFIWSLFNYIFTSPKDAIQQVVVENYFNQAQLSAILIALGVVIIELRKQR